MHAPVLERAGGVGALVLDVKTLDADLLAQGLAVVQRGAALEEGHRPRRVDRQERGIAPDAQRPPTEVVRPHP